MPAPSFENVLADQAFADPRTETETALAAIWSEVLKIERVGIHQDFFELGGHSLLAIKAVSRIRDVFEFDLPTRTLFANATIASLAKVLEGASGRGDSSQRIERRIQSGSSPLSFGQEQLWFLDQLAPNSPIYNIVDVVRFTSSDSDSIKRALNALVERHDALRTAIADSDGKPVQFVLPTLELALHEVDLSAMSEAEREREWLRIAREDGRKGFVLSTAPLFRSTLIRLNHRDHLLVLTLHHIIVDEWSMEVIHRELHQLYAAFSQGRSASLPELPIRYADFACWQRDQSQQEMLQRQTTYWKEELAGAPTILELPTDRPRPAVQSLHGGTEIFDLPRELLASLKSLGQQEHATLFMTLAAGFTALLYRYTGQDDILVGTPISGRTRSETESLVGLFVNSVVLRTRFSDDLSFRSLLRQVREKALGAYTHQDISFGRLVAELAPQRDPSRTPLFQVMFVLHNPEAESQTSSVDGARQLETGTSKFDLTLFLSERDGNLQGLIEYCADLFDKDSVRRLFGHYRTLLEAMIDRPDQRVATAPMLLEAEREKLLVEWNNTAVTRPNQDRCLHQIIDQQATDCPDDVAVVCGQQRLTYGELNRRSNQVAHYLKKFGVGPDVLVGLCMERSLDMVVALLGILKAGGAYLPLDPTFPQNRLGYMVQDSGLRLLVTHRGLEKNLPLRPAIVVRLDADWKAIVSESSVSLLPEETPANLAYVLYTSGSTGKPKGVEVPHAALVNFLLSMQREPGFEAAETLLAVTTLSFDIAGLELYLPLVSGGSVVIASSEDSHDSVRLMELMHQCGCDVMQATPATWQALVDAGWQGSKI